MIYRPEASGIHLGNLNPSSSWLWFDALWWQNPTAASILMRAILQPGTPWNVLHLDEAFFWSQLLDQDNIGDSGTHLKPPWFPDRIDWHFNDPSYLHLQKIKTSSNLCICLQIGLGRGWELIINQIIWNCVTIGYFVMEFYCIYPYIFVTLNEIIHYMHCLSVWAL